MGPAIASSTASLPTATNSSQALSNLQSFQSGMQSPEAQLQKAQQDLGVTAAQQQVSGLQQAINNTTNLLNNVAPSVMGRTGNSLVTSAQANAQIANEQAPIETQLNKENQDYGVANTDYANREQQAENIANAEQTSQNNQLGYLQNIYQALYGQEQNAAQQAEQKRQFDAQLEESKREANLNYSLQHGAAPTLATPSLGSQLNSGQLSGISFKTPGNGAQGFNFSSGNTPVSANAWARANGINIGDLLYSMGQAGDKYSAQAYQDIAANGGQLTPQLKSKYSALFWGT